MSTVERMTTETVPNDPILVSRDEGGSSNEPSDPDQAQDGPHSGTDQPLKLDDNQSVNPDPAESLESSADNHPESSKQPQNLVSEIRALQERLLQLEEQAAGELNIDPNADAEAREEKELRKQIRRARVHKKWINKTEERAEETRMDRDKLGIYGPYIKYITDTGEVAEEAQFYERNGQSRPVGPANDRESDYWTEVVPKPKRGVRFPTSLRPVYSRKLGPPTQWDMSDSEEWNSDDSTASRDFDYFRARLRGDFEWELDRLSAQKRRYEEHKSKKREKELAMRAEEERKRERERQQAAADERDEERASGSQTGDEDDDSRFQKVSEICTLPGLQSLEWNMFRSVRNIPIASSYSIYILIGEPKIWNDAYGNFFGYRFRAAAGGRTHSGSIAAAKSIATAKTDAAHPAGTAKQTTTHPSRQDGQAPLPERIRIHSKQLIKTLSVIHGSDLVLPEDADRNYTVVMMRPYRMLNYYKDEIREWHTKLVEEFQPTKPAADAVKPAEKPADAATGPETEAEASGEQTEEEKPKVEDPEGLSRSKTTLKHLPCLLEFIDGYIAEKVAHVNSARCEKISFSDIWYLFKPGDLVISSDGKQAYQVVKITSGRHIGTDRLNTYYAKDREESDESKQDFSIHCAYVHFDGKQLGPVLKTFSVKKFDGDKAVTALDVYPLRFHVLKDLNARTVKPKQSGAELEEVVEKGVAELRERLIKRGRLFVEVAAVKHMYYAGLTVDTRDEVESQVMIDFEEAFMVEKNRRPDITRLVGTTPFSDTDEDVDCKADCCRGENVHEESYVESKRYQDFINNMMSEIEDNPRKLPSVAIFPRTLEDLKTEDNALKEDELLIMSSCVYGFVLRDRTWAQLDLDYLSEVTDASGGDAVADEDDEDEDDKTAFGRLVLPKGHKEMVLSLISQHFRNKVSQKGREEQVDIVRGKGKGLIILLHGAPGVGKTTTAEGVAEKFKKPLFQITCGDLGSSAREVEAALQTNFALANRWDCILLLDEADVFLAERRRDDFSRNGLVAVFLRVLEYYAGILFLTTNRIGDFDEAFASRIHMSLHYPPLDELSTTKVFKLNLSLIRARYKEAGRKIKIDEDEILHKIGTYWRTHEKARWNGRQIRNACQTALALAEFDAQPPGSKYDLQVRSDAKVHLKLGNVETVSNAYLEFMEYLKAVHGTDSETYAKETGLRALESAIVAALKRGKSGEGGSSSHEDRQRENPLHSFKLKTAPQTQQGMPSSSVPEQPYNSQLQSQPQHREGTPAPAQSGPYGQGTNLAVPQGDDGRFAAISRGHAPNVAASNFQQPTYGNVTQGQFHQPSGQHPSAPPQHGAYTLNTALPGSAPYNPGPSYHSSTDPRVGGGPLHEQGGVSHWNEPYPAADPRRGGQPDQNPELGQVEYERREPPGRGGYQ